MNASYISDTLPPTTPCVALLNGANPIYLTADDVAKNLSRSFDADRVDLLMVKLDSDRSIDVTRKGQRITFKVNHA